MHNIELTNEELDILHASLLSYKHDIRRLMGHRINTHGKLNNHCLAELDRLDSLVLRLRSEASTKGDSKYVD